MTPREEVTGGTDDIETAHMEIEQVPHKVLPDPVLHPHDLGQSASILRTPLDDPSAAHPSIHSTGIEFLRPTAPIGSIPAGLAGDPRGQSSSIQSTPAGDRRDEVPTEHLCWQQTGMESFYTEQTFGGSPWFGSESPTPSASGSGSQTRLAGAEPIH